MNAKQPKTYKSLNVPFAFFDRFLSFFCAFSCCSGIKKIYGFMQFLFGGCVLVTTEKCIANRNFNLRAISFSVVVWYYVADKILWLEPLLALLCHLLSLRFVTQSRYKVKDVELLSPSRHGQLSALIIKRATALRFFFASVEMIHQLCFFLMHCVWTMLSYQKLPNDFVISFFDVDWRSRYRYSSVFARIAPVEV